MRSPRPASLILSAALTLAACGSPATTPSPSEAVPSEQPQVSASASASAAFEGLVLVAIGDSIPYNSPDDCFECTGFVDRYADALAAATGKEVEVRNRSQHNSQTLPGLLAELDRFADGLAEAHVILVGIAHNSLDLQVDKPCGAPVVIPDDDLPDWSKLDEACAVALAERHRPEYESLFSQIVALREGKPTIFRTVNRYNDWIGWSGVEGVPDPEKTKVMIDVWNAMLCEAAEANGFGCADIYHAFN